MVNTEPEISWSRVAAFIRQHNHDVRNGLNSLELESALLQELVSGEEEEASVARLRNQLRALGDQLRALSALFQEPQPYLTPIAASELLAIWQEQHAAIPLAPQVVWTDELSDEKVNTDVEMLAGVFQELMSNATSFWESAPFRVTVRSQEGEVRFELEEPKQEAPDTSRWGEPFTTTRRGGYGLGLWLAHRRLQVCGATIARRYDAEEKCLRTVVALPVAVP